jgi:transcriptional regulator with XRE-family HTH domain
VTRAQKRDNKKWRLRVGSAVRRAREVCGVTQLELAAAIGVGVETVSNTERGATVPDYATVEAMADFLGCKIDELTGRSDPVDSAGDELAALARGALPGDALALRNAILVIARDIYRRRGDRP